MRFARILVSFALLIAPAIGLASDPSGFPAGDDFGAGITLQESTPLSEVVAHPERFEDGPILIRGRISDVCQKKGCWTVITDDVTTIRVRFHDYGFFLPKDSSGRMAIAEGLVKAETLSENAVRHYASESKLAGDGLSEISGPQRVVGFTATAVRLLR